MTKEELEAELLEDEKLTETDPIFQFFGYSHLRIDLQSYSAPFYRLAKFILKNYPRNAERNVALRKLLESKDAAVRSLLMKS